MKKYIICSFFILSSLLFPQENEILYPIGGSEIFQLNDHVDWIDGFEVIKISTEEDLEQVRSYFLDILKDKDKKPTGDMTILDQLAIFRTLKDRSGYVLICAHNDLPLVYTKPFFKNNKVWFDADYNTDTNAKTVSLWFFCLPDSMDLRIRLDGEGHAAEFGLFSFMPDRFKKGQKINEKYGDIRVTGYGEYFEERYNLIIGDKIRDYIITGLKNYTDTLPARIGMTFGLRCEMTTENMTEKEYSTRIIHPKIEQGPKKGVTVETSSKVFKKDEPAYVLWQFHEAYELLPGEWEIQIRDRDKLIYSKTFHIFLD